MDLSALPSGATQLDVFFLPCEHAEGQAPDRVLRGWSREATEALARRRSGRPQLLELTVYASGDLTYTALGGADAGPRVARAECVASTVLPGGRLLARAVATSPASASEFPVRRSYDAVTTVSRARWSVNNRVALHVDRSREEGSGHEIATVYVRYQHGRDVDVANAQKVLREAVDCVLEALGN